MRFYITVALCLISAVLLASFFFNRAAGYIGCRYDWKDSGLDYRYKLSGVCQVKVEKGWIPAKNYRVE